MAMILERRKALLALSIMLAATAMAGCRTGREPKPSVDGTTTRIAYTLSEIDQPPRVVERAAPAYPSEAKRPWVQGVVTLKFIVTRKGIVLHPEVVKADPPGVFDASALEAIAKWRFKPAIKDGREVDVIIIAPLRFELVK